WRSKRLVRRAGLDPMRLGGYARRVRKVSSSHFSRLFTASMARHRPNGASRSNDCVLHRNGGKFEHRAHAEAGSLMSYPPSQIDQSHRTTNCIDKILRGAKPEDLSVQELIKFEFAINLKTVKALGLSIPPLLLARADEVIE